MNEPNSNTWKKFSEQLRSVGVAVRKGASIHVNSKAEIGSIESLLESYFRELRPEIKRKGLNEETLKILDGHIETLKGMLSKRVERSIYLRLLKDIGAKFSELEIQNQYSISDLDKSDQSFLAPIETKIYLTLEKIRPQTAASYRQLIADLQDQRRVSFKGTVHELRETLRETLASLAPDEEVSDGPDFILEDRQTKPTMRQKVKFILGLRGTSGNDLNLAVKSTELIDMAEDTTTSLVKTVYDSGSGAAHTEAVKKHVGQLKMYLDAVLCHLLELS